MKLIDMDVAIDAISEMMPTPYTPDGSHPADEGIFMAQELFADCIQTIEDLPIIEQPKIIHCKDCRYWSDYICFCEDHDIRCQDYYIGDMHTESDFYCGYAKRKQNEVKE